MELAEHESFLYVPLVAGRRANGLLVLSWAEPLRVLSTEERRFVETLAGQAAQALDRASHFEIRADDRGDAAAQRPPRDAAARRGRAARGALPPGNRGAQRRRRLVRRDPARGRALGTRRRRRGREGRPRGSDDGPAPERAARVLARPHEAVVDASRASTAWPRRWSRRRSPPWCTSSSTRTPRVCRYHVRRPSAAARASTPTAGRSSSRAAWAPARRGTGHQATRRTSSSCPSGRCSSSTPTGSSSARAADRRGPGRAATGCPRRARASPEKLVEHILGAAGRRLRAGRRHRAPGGAPACRRAASRCISGFRARSARSTWSGTHFGAWLDGTSQTGTDAQDVVLAVVGGLRERDRARPDRAGGDVGVRTSRRDDSRVRISIADTGRWAPPTERRTEGWGSGLIQRPMSSVESSRRPTRAPG